MSLERTCGACGEEYDMRHGSCPACEWRVKRIAQLEAEVKIAKIRIAGYKAVENYCEGLQAEVERLREAIEETLADRGPCWASILRQALAGDE